MYFDPYEVYSVVNGTIRLDGGAMFGVVPKVLWEKVTDVDDVNRILLATRTLLAVDRSAGRVILVDTGCGPKWTPERAERYAITYSAQAIPQALAKLDLAPDAVTDVVVSHLHFDHNGGLTDWVDDPDGPTCLRYPGARHWIHKKHWEHAQSPHIKDRASFLAEDMAALAEPGILTLVDGEHPAPPYAGMEWFVSHGHTPYQLHPIFGAGDARILFAGDIVPTVAHLRLGWVMAYDVAPLVTISEKQAIYSRCLELGMCLAFPHDHRHGGVTIDGTIARPIVVESLDL